MKLTKRKGFNFFRSYYDVYNELSNKDKVQFIDALFDRQFLGVKPKKLKGMAKFAYISQTNSIDSQVKGFEDKTGIVLTPTEPPTYGGNTPPTPQVEEKEQVQVEEITTNFPFIDFWNSYDHKKGKHLTEKKWNLLNNEKKEAIMKVVLEYVKSTPDPHFRKYPLTWLHGEHWTDEITTASNGIPSEPDQSWIATKGKDTQLYQEAAKKWREAGWVYERNSGSTIYKWNKIKE